MSAREKSDSEDDSGDEDYIPPNKEEPVSEEDDSGDEEVSDGGTQSKTRTSIKGKSREQRKRSVADEWSAFEEQSGALASKIMKASSEEKPLKEVAESQATQVKTRSVGFGSGVPKAFGRSGGFGSTGRGLKAIAEKLGGKDSKKTTFERTRLDWDKFKKCEGIEEELQQHTRGKESFVERQEFLQRSDFRQFEKEKAVRDENRRRATLNSAAGSTSR